MLKKILKAVATLILLVGVYYGYVCAFDIVVDQLKAIRRPDTLMFAVHDSTSKREAIAHAQAAFGRNHWSAAEDLTYRYYNSERGFWIYAQEWKKPDEEDGVRYNGKRMRLRPFALIMKSKDGENTKTITSDRAVFDLSEPLSFNVNASGEPMKINHAHLEPNVEIRDDKGTPDDPSDDMRIGPLTTLDYDDAIQQITTDSYVVIRDPDMAATADGMLIQLRKNDEPRPAGSTGFGGAERLDLNKNVHVMIRDVGQSGMMGSAPAPSGSKGSAQAKAKVSGETDQGKSGPQPADEPTPLNVTCDSKMQVWLPKPQLPVRVGPPAPPAPTLVQFDRNVVALQGPLDKQPHQLTCDSLKLTLVPEEKPAPTEKAPPAESPNQDPAKPARDAASDHLAANTEDVSRNVVQAETPGGDVAANSESKNEKPKDGDNKGLFGDLTLERVHATGHAVWLYLPSEGVKLRCNELIHVREAPSRPARTYFRGDVTRPLDLEKVDLVGEEGPEKGKISSVTHIRTVDATMLDNGSGMNTANVVANGPGRLETQPDRDRPVERIAIWQDKLYLRNELGPEGQVVRKIIDLTGNRPCFVDKVQETSLDSARWIRVWLKPKPRSAAPATDDILSSRSPASIAGSRAQTNASTTIASPVPPTFSSRGANTDPRTGDHQGPGAADGSGTLQIEHLWAHSDVHLLAPSKTMTAREWLNAEFIDAGPAPLASAAPARADDSSSSTATGTAPAEGQSQESPSAQEQVAAQSQAAPPPPEPPMVGSADRIWAKLEMKPKTNGAAGSNQGAAASKTSSTARTRTAATAPGKNESNAEIRKVWMLGSVSLHQDPEQGKTKGQDASGEALYLDNRGPNKVFTEIYQREPNEKTYLPGPLPPARVEKDEMKITAAGTLTMNQETDQAWVVGPGVFTQMPARTPDPPVNAGGADTERANSATRRRNAPESEANARADKVLARRESEDGSAAPQDTTTASQPKTRAGRPVSEQAPTTIAFSKEMVFNGRSIDPEGTPAARADFFGIVTAQMEDALLHSEEKMIAYTDRVVPLAQLGAMSKGRSKPKPSDSTSDAANAETDTQPQLTLIYSYHNAVGISRKIDTDTPTVLQYQRIEADDLLAYDRRSGDFEIPGKGIVYLYDRSDNSSRAPGMDLEREKSPDPTGTPRTVTPTARRQPSRSSGAANASPAPPAGRQASRSSQAPSNRDAVLPGRPKTSSEAKTNGFPPLVLTQIQFTKEMRGRFQSEQQNDTVATNWYEFFGDIQLARAKVPNAESMLKFDKLPSDGLFLTCQTLRVITEPPPVGSPPSTPARDYVKAWEKAFVWSSDESLQSDIITYDSDKDLIFAFADEGRKVSYAQQHAAGQPASQGLAKAVQLNPKTGAIRLIDNDSIQLVDKNTGARPVAAMPVDPDAKKAKPPRKPMRLPPSNVERRGFTGQ